MTCGMYLMFLMIVSLGCMIAAVHSFRMWLGNVPAPVDRAGPPWWFFVISIPVSFALALGGAAILDAVLTRIEYVAFFRRKCPVCGGRRWSRGFTRGFGL